MAPKQVDGPELEKWNKTVDFFQEISIFKLNKDERTFSLDEDIVKKLQEKKHVDFSIMSVQYAKKGIYGSGSVDCKPSSGKVICNIGYYNKDVKGRRKVFLGPYDDLRVSGSQVSMRRGGETRIDSQSIGFVVCSQGRSLVNDPVMRCTSVDLGGADPLTNEYIDGEVKLGLEDFLSTEKGDAST